MYQSFIGKSSGKVLNTVEAGAVKKFAEALGDHHPIYFDQKYAKSTRLGRNMAPPTFPLVFNYGSVPELNLPEAGLIHGEERFQYERPLFIGEDLNCYVLVKQYYEKSGGSGLMGFLVLDHIGEDLEGNRIFTATTTCIISEAVRKEITV
jgi:acyl dehydratase